MQEIKREEVILSVKDQLGRLPNDYVFIFVGGILPTEFLKKMGISRHALGLRFGKIRNWLNIHIFFGIMGPIFVTLHTAFKFGEIDSFPS